MTNERIAHLEAEGRWDMRDYEMLAGSDRAGRSPRIDMDQHDGSDLVIDQTERGQRPPDFAFLEDVINDLELNSKPEGQVAVGLAKTAEAKMSDLFARGKECPLRIDGPFREEFKKELAEANPDASEMDIELFIRELEGFPPISRDPDDYELTN